nr:MAG TPA: endodeoxyribonuclease I [Bacteriophage sp.]
MNIINTNLKFGTLTKRKSTERIILHHRAGYGSIESIHKLHSSYGWSGIGYHIYIRRDGTIYQGRPIDMIGAHSAGSNYNSVGVCFEGNFETDTMSEAQINAGKQVVAYLKLKYGINKVLRHSDVCRTACPGKNFPFNQIANSVEVGNSDVNNTTTIVKDTTSSTTANSIIETGQAHANNFTSANIVIDGIRGSETKKAGIKVLQTAMNLDYNAKLKVDGEAGTETYKALGYHYVRRGETQYMVTAVQILLMLKGYDCQLECPGIFGSNLEAAVKKYQRDYQLTVDGIAGRNTILSLIH